MKRILISSLVVIAMHFFAQAQKPMSLTDCIAYAMENHTEVRVGKLKMQDADWLIKQNTSIAYPQLNLGINAQRFIQQPALPAEALGFEGLDPGTKLKFTLKNNIAGNVQLSQLLFNSSVFSGIKAAKMFREYSGLQLSGIMEKVRNDVIEAYLPALIMTESIDILDKNIEIQQSLYNETKATFQAGFVEQLDIDRLDYILSVLKTQRESLARNKDIVIDRLKFTMNMPVTDTISLSDNVEALLAAYGALDPEEELDYMNRPDYVALLKGRELSEIQVDLYRKDWLPTLSLYGSYNPSFQGNDKLYWVPSAVVGVQLSMPIFDGGLSRAQEERAIITTMEVDERKKQMTNGFDLQVEAARKNYYSAQMKLKDQEHNLDLAKRIYDTSEKKFKEGLGSSFEVTQAQSGYYEAQASWLQARFDFLNSIILLRNALGKSY